MQINGTTTTPNTGASNEAASARVAQKTLGQKDFLKLISVQLANQDPMKPMEDTAFIAQMSSFTALENSTQMLSQFAQLRSSNNLSLARSLMGQEVTVLDPESKKTVTGEVTGVDTSGSTPNIVIDGKSYDLNSIQKVNTPADASTAGTSTTN